MIEAALLVTTVSSATAASSRTELFALVQSAREIHRRPVRESRLTFCYRRLASGPRKEHASCGAMARQRIAERGERRAVTLFPIDRAEMDAEFVVQQRR